MRGTVKTFSARHGFGFIGVDDDRDVFFHVAEVKSSGSISVGACVEFDVEMGEKGSRAKNIHIITDTPQDKPKFFSFQNVHIKLDTISMFSLGVQYWILINGVRFERVRSFIGKPTESVEEMARDRIVVSQWLGRVIENYERYDFPENCSVSELQQAGIDAEIRGYPLLNIKTYQHESYDFIDFDDPDSVTETYSRLLGYMS